MTSHEPYTRPNPSEEARQAGDRPARTATPTGQEIGPCEDTTSTERSSVEPKTAWSELGFDQALATRCAPYGWTANRVSDYLCRDHGDADPLDTILNGCDPLEALIDHATDGDDR